MIEKQIGQYWIFTVIVQYCYMHCRLSFLSSNACLKIIFKKNYNNLATLLSLIFSKSKNKYPFSMLYINSLYLDKIVNNFNKDLIVYQPFLNYLQLIDYILLDILDIIQ